MKFKDNKNIIVLSITAALIMISFFPYFRSVDVKEIQEECACDCHKKHKKELEALLKNLRTEREEISIFKAVERERIMNEQENLCISNLDKMFENFGIIDSSSMDNN